MTRRMAASVAGLFARAGTLAALAALMVPAVPHVTLTMPAQHALADPRPAVECLWLPRPDCFTITNASRS